MIFPNHPAYAEIRAGMGYAAPAHDLGYQPGAHALLGMLGQAGPQGSISADMVANAEADGYNASDLQLLGSIGATDDDIVELLNSETTLTQLYAKYGVTIPAGSTAVQSTAPSATSTAQSPPGSTLLYTASYNAVKAFTTASTVIADIAAQLTAHGMSMLTNAVQQSGLMSNASFTMTVMDSVGHQYLTDAQSVLDALLNQFTSNGKISSSVTMVSPGTTASGQPGGVNPQPPASDFGTWLENNAVVIGVSVAGLVLVSSLIGRRR